MPENHFYVYEHWRPDKGVCFYVGKGAGKRAWNLRQRNQWHKSISSKLTSLGYAVDVRVVSRNLTSAEAFALEMERIAFYGRDTLVNLTDGGDGPNNVFVTLETRAKIAAAHRGKKRSEEAKEKTAAALRGRKRPPEVVAKVVAALTGRSISPERRAALAMQAKAITQETKDKISQTLRGRPCPEGTKEKLRLFFSGKPLTAEHRAKIGAANKGKRSALGVKHTPETRAKMAASARLREERKRMMKVA